MTRLGEHAVLVTRSREQAPELTVAIQAAGLIAIHFPLIALREPTDEGTISAITAAIQQMEQYDWILFTSVNGVHYFMQHLKRLQIDLRSSRARVVAVGPKTAEILLEYGCVAKRPPSFYQAEGLLDAIRDELIPGQKVLIPTSNLARDYLQEQMTLLGLEVTRITVYVNQLQQEDGEKLVSLFQSKEIDSVTLTSPSTVRNLFAVLEYMGVDDPLALLDGISFFCIGHKTAEAAVELGITSPIIAKQATTESLVESIVERVSGKCY